MTRAKGDDDHKSGNKTATASEDTIEAALANHWILRADELRAGKDGAAEPREATMVPLSKRSRPLDSAMSSAAITPASNVVDKITRRRAALACADAHNRIEGQSRDAQSDAVFEAHIRGEIDATEIVPRLKAQLGIS
jgi:Antitoxin VbhA